MDAIEHAAYVSVGRACGFATLAAGIIFLSLSFDPALAMRVAGEFALIVTGSLFLYGLRAPRRPYHRTEAWLILNADYRPPKAIAQKIVGTALKEQAFGFARRGAVCTALLLTASLVVQFSQTRY